MRHFQLVIGLGVLLTRGEIGFAASDLAATRRELLAACASMGADLERLEEASAEVFALSEAERADLRRLDTSIAAALKAPKGDTAAPARARALSDLAAARDKFGAVSTTSLATLDKLRAAFGQRTRSARARLGEAKVLAERVSPEARDLDAIRKRLVGQLDALGGELRAGQRLLERARKPLADWSAAAKAMGSASRGAAGDAPSAGSPEPGNTGGELDEQVQSMFDASMEFLMLQTKIQNLSQATQMLSNIMKADSDAKLNAIRNVRS